MTLDYLFLKITSWSSLMTCLWLTARCYPDNREDLLLRIHPPTRPRTNIMRVHINISQESQNDKLRHEGLIKELVSDSMTLLIIQNAHRYSLGHPGGQ